MNQAMQAGAGVRADHRARFAITVDAAPKTVAVPKGLGTARRGSAAAKAAFEQTSRAQQRHSLARI